MSPIEPRRVNGNEPEQPLTSGDAQSAHDFAEALADSVMDDEADEGYFSQSEEPAK